MQGQIGGRRHRPCAERCPSPGKISGTALSPSERPERPPQPRQARAEGLTIRRKVAATLQITPRSPCGVPGAVEYFTAM
jgi:hypothetical protein